MAMRLPVSLLNSIDLPTFGLPTMATMGFAISLPPFYAEANIPPLLTPFFSFSIRRKKRTVSHREEKKETTREPFGRFSGLSIDQSLALDLRRMKVLGCIRRQINDRHHQDSVRRVVARGKVIWGGQIKPGK